jgi:hypothetical protein
LKVSEDQYPSCWCLFFVIIFASICTLARTCYVAADGWNKRIHGNRSTTYELVVIQSTAAWCPLDPQAQGTKAQTK